MNQKGVVLIEVLAAVVILGLAGLSTLGHLRAVMEAQARVHAREAEMEAAEDLMVELAVLTHGELSQRLGIRIAGPFVVWIDRPEPSLFRIGIAPSERPEAEILATLLHRRVETEAEDER